MKQSRVSTSFLVVAGFGLLALGSFVTHEVKVTAAPAVNTNVYLLANLLGASEVPTTGDPDGKGSAGVFVNTDSMFASVCWTVNLSGIDAVTGVQMRSGAAGVNGPVVFDMGLGESACAPNPVDLMVAEDIATNPSNYYVNVDTSGYPSGALRGQLINNALPLILVGLTTPVRAYDSRVDGTKLASNETRVISLFAGKDGAGFSLPGVPIGAYAAAVTITVTQSNAAGFLSAHAAGSPVPATSTINWTFLNTTVATSTIVRLDDLSQVAITAGPGANTHIIIDVLGFYWDWGLAFN